MRSRVGRVAEVLTHDVKHDRDDRGDNDGSPEFELHTGREHRGLRGTDEFAERNNGHRKSDVAEEYFI